MVDLKGLGRMDGPLDGILMVCGLFSPWRLDYSFFFSFGAVFTGQGYFVIAINPTGSTSFGQGESYSITTQLPLNILESI